MAVNRIVVGTLSAAVLAATGLGWATVAKADPGCQTALWGFLGSQRRAICDGPLRPDGSWLRARVIFTPAHNIPVFCSGSYFISCSGGGWVDTTITDQESYPVTPDTVLPDEPGHLGGLQLS